MEILSPPDWPRPKGYANAIRAEGHMLFLAGMVGWDHNEQFQSDDMLGQCEQVLTNIMHLLKTAHARPQDMTRMVWYVTDMPAYRRNREALGRLYRDIIGDHYPVMTCVAVTALVEPQAKIEIEVTAMLA